MRAKNPLMIELTMICPLIDGFKLMDIPPCRVNDWKITDLHNGSVEVWIKYTPLDTSPQPGQDEVSHGKLCKNCEGG